MTEDEARKVEIAVAIDRDVAQEQLTDLVAKIDAEGLDYFLTGYGGETMVPELKHPEHRLGLTLREKAHIAKQALDDFTTLLEELCDIYGVEYE